jgi:hypothetical protein
MAYLAMASLRPHLRFIPTEQIVPGMIMCYGDKLALCIAIHDHDSVYMTLDLLFLETGELETDWLMNRNRVRGVLNEA